MRGGQPKKGRIRLSGGVKIRAALKSGNIRTEPTGNDEKGERLTGGSQGSGGKGGGGGARCYLFGYSVGLKQECVVTPKNYSVKVQDTEKRYDKKKKDVNKSGRGGSLVCRLRGILPGEDKRATNS